MKERLEVDYWSVLAGKFRLFVLDLGAQSGQMETMNYWFDSVVLEGNLAFDHVAEAAGDDGATLHKIEEGKQQCRNELNILKGKVKKGV